MCLSLIIIGSICWHWDVLSITKQRTYSMGVQQKPSLAARRLPVANGVGRHWSGPGCNNWVQGQENGAWALWCLYLPSFLSLGERDRQAVGVGTDVHGHLGADVPSCIDLGICPNLSATEFQVLLWNCSDQWEHCHHQLLNIIDPGLKLPNGLGEALFQYSWSKFTVLLQYPHGFLHLGLKSLMLNLDWAWLFLMPIKLILCSPPEFLVVFFKMIHLCNCQVCLSLLKPDWGFQIGDFFHQRLGSQFVLLKSPSDALENGKIFGEGQWAINKSALVNLMPLNRVLGVSEQFIHCISFHLVLLQLFVKLRVVPSESWELFLNCLHVEGRWGT